MDRQPNEAIISMSRTGKAIDIEPALYRAMVTCLTTAEKCEMFQENIKKELKRRRIILSIISEDMLVKYEPEHAKLTEELITELPSLGYKAAITHANFLNTIGHTGQPNYLDDIIEVLLASGFKPVRDQAASLVQIHWKEKHVLILRDLCPDRLGSALQTVYTAKEAIEVLFESRTALYEHLTPHNASTLYHRLIQIYPQVLEDLREGDPITYMYLAAKEGISVAPDVAFSIARKAYFDKKFGLVVWSIGRLKLWEVLTRICENLEEWERDKKDRFMQQLGIKPGGLLAGEAGN